MGCGFLENLSLGREGDCDAELSSVYRRREASAAHDH